MNDFPNLEAKVSALHSELTTLKDLIATGFQKVDNNFNVFKQDMSGIHKKIDTLTKSVEALGNTTNEGLEDVGGKIESLTEEISKISAVTRYGDEYNNLKAVNR